MDLPYVLQSDYPMAGSGAGQVELPLVNMVVHKYDSEPNPIIESRSAITPWQPVSASAIVPGVAGQPIKALFQLDGVFDSATTHTYFAVTNGHLYKIVYTSSVPSVTSTDLGAVAGSGPAKIVGEAGAVFVTCGTTLYYYNGAALATVATPGGFNVRDIVIGASRLVVIDDGTGKIFWTDPLGTTLPALNFATAEYSPDNAQALLYIGDTLVILGSQTVEYWPSTGDPDAPFQPIVGKTNTVGILTQDTAPNTFLCSMFDGGFAWINTHGQVCFNDQSNVISTLGIEYWMFSATSMYSFWMNSQEFLAINTNNPFTFVYSAHSKTWCKFATDGRNNFTAQCSSGKHVSSAPVLLGSQYHGALMTFGNWSYTEQDYIGSAITDINFERTFRAGMPLTNETLKVDSLTLRTSPGINVFGNGVVNLKVTRGDGTWSANKPRSLGANGSYRKDITWRSLGQYSQPYFLAEFTVLTNKQPFYVSAVKVNEPRVGH